MPLVNYGLCEGGETSTAATPPGGGTLTPIRAALRAAGFDYVAEVTPQGVAKVDINDPTGNVSFGSGIVKNIKGNRLADIPNGQIGVGGQYTMHLDDYTLIPRLDYYWQSSMRSRVNNDPGSDYIGSWDEMNGQILLTAPDAAWYAKVFATNIFDKRNPTGVYLTDPTSALFTNVFSEDPRVVGVSVGASW